MLSGLEMTVRRRALTLLPLGVLLFSFGCATADFPMATTQWVNDRLKPIEDRLVRIETTAAAEKARLDQLTGRVGELGTQLNQVSAVATEARTIGAEARAIGNRAVEAAAVADRKAEQGIAKANEVDARVTRSLANRYKRQQVQAFSVTYPAGKSELSDTAEKTLQDVAKMLVDNPTYTADVIGETDMAGAARYNINLSWRREEAVRRFLVEKGADLNRLSFIGLGEERATAKAPAARAAERHTAIIVYRPAD
jgi:outer membrane protein OmpA-like peptidoglycan-associated protein